MSIEPVDVASNSINNEYKEEEALLTTTWNGLDVSPECTENKVLEEIALNFFKEIHIQPGVTTCSFLWGYFDPENRALNDFEIKVMMNAIQCSSKEEQDKKLKELEGFVNGLVLSTGVITIAIFSKDYKTAAISATALFFLLKEKLWMTQDQLNIFLKKEGKTYEDLHFCTLIEDYMKNQQELISKGIILDMLNPMYTENSHYTKNPHYNKPLDPSFKPFTS